MSDNARELETTDGLFAKELEVAVGPFSKGVVAPGASRTGYARLSCRQRGGRGVHVCPAGGAQRRGVCLDGVGVVVEWPGVSDGDLWISGW